MNDNIKQFKNQDLTPYVIDPLCDMLTADPLCLCGTPYVVNDPLCVCVTPSNQKVL